MESKVCNKCLVEKVLTDFYFENNKPLNQCKKCKNKQRTENRRKEPLKTKQKRLSKDWERKFGYSRPDNYNELFIAQEGKCAICGKHQSEMKKALSLDHNHITGRTRGLLCSNCNWGLGNFKSDYGIELLQKAIEYSRDRDS